MAVAHDGQPPSLVLDAGTGIRRVAALLDGAAYRGAIVLGHLHWDHTQGLPFFTAGDRPDARVRLYAPAQGDTEEVLTRFMSPPHFPISPSQLRGTWSIAALEPGEIDIEGFSVTAREIPHKGGRTYGYRVSDGRATLSYLSDHCPTQLGPGPKGLGELHQAALELAAECDVLVYDAQYTDEELSERAHFGHAACGYAVSLTLEAGARRLLLYHHDPPRTDDQVDAMVARYGEAGVPVQAAAQGMVFDLP